MIELFIITVVSLDKSAMLEERFKLSSFKLESIDASILIDCGVSLGSDDPMSLPAGGLDYFDPMILPAGGLYHFDPMIQ